MLSYFLAGTGGWLAAILLCTVALLPYLLRRTRASIWLGMAPASNGFYLRRMWPHYWLAYAATGLSVMHAWVLMSKGRALRTSSAGLNLATLALLLLLLQIVMGRSLQQTSLTDRKSVRRWHFWTMAGVVLLVAAHVWLNG